MNQSKIPKKKLKFDPRSNKTLKAAGIDPKWDRPLLYVAIDGVADLADCNHGWPGMAAPYSGAPSQ